MKSKFLLVTKSGLEIFNGVKTFNDDKGTFLQLANTMERSLPSWKLKVYLDKDSSKAPEVIKGRVHSVFLAVKGGKRFRDRGAYLVAQKSTKSDSVLLFSNVQFKFDTNWRKEKGDPNASIATGVILLKQLDSIVYIHNEQEYRIMNISGSLTLEKISEKKQSTSSSMIKTEISVTETAPEKVVVDKADKFKIKKIAAPKKTKVTKGKSGIDGDLATNPKLLALKSKLESSDTTVRPRTRKTSKKEVA